MPPLVRRDIWFDSSDGRSKVAGYIYSNPYVVPFCVLQISHGMCEYMTRYEDFADFMSRNGVAVCGNDHLGHGTTAQDEGDLGYFSEEDGRRFAIQDLRIMNGKVREVFPKRPVVLLGHSMGSFFARKYATKWPQTIDGLIISGTGGPRAGTGAGIRLASLVGRMRGEKHRSKLLMRLAFGSYLDKIREPKTIYDWLSRDAEVVRAFNEDPKCNYMFTANGFHELFSALQDVTGPEWAQLIRKNMPVLMVQGDADPVGDYGRGTAIVRDWLREAGVKHVKYKTYPGARHEVLNELCRGEVYRDILSFIELYWSGMKKVEEPKRAPGPWVFTSKKRKQK